jgi:hypothetical protein
MSPEAELDVLIIGAACRFKTELPQLKFALLEARAVTGGWAPSHNDLLDFFSTLWEPIDDGTLEFSSRAPSARLTAAAADSG